MTNTITHIMKVGVPLSKKTLGRRLGHTRKHMNWMIKNLLEAGKLRRATPMEVGSGKCSFSEVSFGEDSRKKKECNKNRKESYEKRRSQKFNVFVLT